MNATAHKQRVYTVLGIALAMFLGALDQTIVSPAMPRVVSDLGGLDRYTWVSTVYLLISTLLVPIYGKLADTMNRKTLQVWSIITFLVGSALCGLAGEFGTLPLLGDGMNQLIVFRGIQALGGAGLFALAFIIVSDLYPPRERGKIGGVFGAVFGLSSILGPLIGGFLTDHATGWLPGVEGWRWVFYVNVPIGAVALWFIITRMPRLHAHDHSHRIDFVSAGLMILGFFPLILGLQLDKTQHPWTSPLVLGLLIGSAVVIAVWILHSLKAEHPIMNLRLYANNVFTTGTLGSFFFGAVFMSLIIFLPLYMVNVQDVSATQAGLSVIPLSLGIVLGAGISGPISSKTGRYKGLLTGGAVVVLASLGLMTQLGVETPFWQVMVLMVVAGIGFGPAQSLYSLAIQNVVSAPQMGQATSSIQFTRQIGSAMGAAVMGAILSASLTAGFEANMPKTSDMASLGSAAQTSQINSKSPSEVRAQIIKAFDEQEARLDALFAARGDEAKKLFDSFMSDTSVPASSKDQLKDGTPAMQVEKGFAQLEDGLKAALSTGNAVMLESILASPAGKVIPAEAAGGLRGLLRLPPPVRTAAAAGLHEKFAPALKDAQDQASAAAGKAVKEALDKTKIEVADGVALGIKKTFAQGVHDVWLAALVAAILMLLTTALMPNLELRARGEPLPEEAKPEGAQV